MSLPTENATGLELATGYGYAGSGDKQKALAPRSLDNPQTGCPHTHSLYGGDRLAPFQMEKQPGTETRLRKCHPPAVAKVLPMYCLDTAVFGAVAVTVCRGRITVQALPNPRSQLWSHRLRPIAGLFVIGNRLKKNGLPVMSLDSEPESPGRPTALNLATTASASGR